MTTLSKLVVKLEAESAKLHSELDKTNRKLRRLQNSADKTGAVLKKAFSGIAILAAASKISKFVNAAINAQSEIRNLTARLGGSVEAWGRLRIVAEQTDVGFNTLSSSAQRLTRRVSEAARGSGEAVSALDELKISADKLNNLSADKQLYVIANALSHVASKSDRVRIAMRLFDTEGVKMLQMLGNGSNALAELEAAAEQSGAALSEVADSRMLALENSIKSAKRELDSFSNNIVSELAPSLATAMDASVSAVRIARRVISISFYALSKFIDSINAKLSSSLKFIKNAAIIVAKSITTALSKAALSVAKVWDQAWKTISQYSSSAMSYISDSTAEIMRVITLYVKTAADKIKEIWSSITQTIRSSINSIAGWINELTNSTVATDKIKEIEEFSNKTTDSVANYVKSAVSSTIDASVQMSKDATAELESVAEKEISAIARFANKTANFAMKMWKHPKDAVDDIYTKLEEIGMGEELDGWAEKSKTFSDNIKSASENWINMSKGRTFPIKKTAAGVKKISDSFKDARESAKRFGDSVVDAFTDAAFSGRGFKDVLSSIALDFAKMAFKKAVGGAFNNIFDTIGSKIGSSISGLFNSDTSSAASAGAVAGARARGGNVSKGKSYLVGERGPEIFTAVSSGKIMQNSETMKYLDPAKSGASIPKSAFKKQAPANVNIIVNVKEDSSKGGEVNSRKSGGNTIIDVLVSKIKTSIAHDIAAGGSSISGSLERTYGVSRTAGAY